MSGVPKLALGALLIVCMGLLSLQFTRRGRDWLMPLLLGSLAAITAVNLWLGSLFALYLLPVMINGFLGVLFGRTLLPGSEPLITRFRRLEGEGDIPPAIAVYTRALTAIWTGVFVLLAAISALLALFAPLEVWSLFTNCLNYGVVAVLFVAEYIYRRTVLRRYAHATPIQFARALARANWAQLAAK